MESGWVDPPSQNQQLNLNAVEILILIFIWGFPYITICLV